MFQIFFPITVLRSVDVTMKFGASPIVIFKATSIEISNATIPDRLHIIAYLDNLSKWAIEFV